MTPQLQGSRAARGLAGAAIAFVVFVCALGAAPAAAESEVEDLAAFPITAETQRLLGSLQRGWLQWLAALRHGDADRAEAALDVLAAVLRDVEMERLPDLSRAAAAAALRAAREGDRVRAVLALAAAERLDPGRPETAFAEARVAAAAGSHVAAVGHRLRGAGQALRLPFEAYLLGNGILLWVLWVMLAAGALFIAEVLAVRGWRVPGELAEALARAVSPPVAIALASVLLLWPLALPGRLVGVLALGTIVSWGRLSRSQRVVAAVIWVLAGIAPMLVTLQRQRVAMELGAPMRVVESLETRRLPGVLLNQAGILGSILPESEAVTQLFADLHRRLGQWEAAGALYRRLAASEPQNVPALVDLGVYYFQVGDLAAAERVFQRAIESNPNNAAAYFDLSQTYSADYRFALAEDALRRARELNPADVSSWLYRSEILQLVTLDGGSARIPEIRAELERRWQASGLLRHWKELGLRGAAAPAALAVIGLAALLQVAWRGAAYRPAPPSPGLSESTQQWARAIVPGLEAAIEGRGARGYLSLMLPAALLALPLAGSVTWAVPWGMTPGWGRPWWIPLLALGAWIGWRIRRELARRRAAA